MIKYTKHIGLTLLLVFTGSLLANSLVSAYNLYQFSTKAEVSISLSSKCESSFSALGNVDKGHSHFHLSKLPDANTDNENGTVIVNNCNSNLALLSTDIIPLNYLNFQSSFSSTVPLLSSQLFVHSIADPPRAA